MPLHEAPATAWYREGLRFECTGCGRCCTGSTGYVWVEEVEIRAMADLLEMRIDDFGRRYLRRVGERYALLEAPGGGDCVFLDGIRCRVYALRPQQCRTFPFWGAMLASPQTWADAARDCEGIRPEAPLVTAREIDSRRHG